jgi:hypothetical protein
LTKGYSKSGKGYPKTEKGVSPFLTALPKALLHATLTDLIISISGTPTALCKAHWQLLFQRQKVFGCQ